GSRIKLAAPDSDSPWLTVVGVCGDLRQNWWDAGARPTLYVPFSQSPARTTYLMIRTAQDPVQIIGLVRTAVRAVDAEQPLEEIHTLEKEISDAVAPIRIIGILMTVFGGIALVLSAVGVYSVFSYRVSERTHEFGLRVALGARPADILSIVGSQTLKLSAIGLIVGLPSSLALGAVVSSLLPGVITLDIGTFAGLSILLVAVSLLAAYVPARRAGLVDPIVALRN